MPSLIEKNNTDIQNAIILSTIHSSKGLEYKRVYIMDAYERILPQVTQYEAEESESQMKKYQEERRLFYVAMTRAKDELYLMAMKDKSTPFIDELFPPVPVIKKTPLMQRVKQIKAFSYYLPPLKQKSSARGRE